MENMTLAQTIELKKTLEKELEVIIVEFEKKMDWKAYIKELYIARYESGASHVHVTLQFR